MKITNPTAPSERLLYPDLSSVSERLILEAAAANEQQINEKIQLIINLTTILTL